MLGLALLVLVPGLLLVRAPWTAVPALSLAFWALSAWWSPAWLSRTSVLAAALVVFVLLLAMRLVPKHEVPPPPGWVASPEAELPPRPGRPPPAFAATPSLLIAAVAVALVAPAPLWRNAPGPRLAFQTTGARLVLWRDGLPLSSEPLLPLGSFGAHAPAIATLSADVCRACGIDAARGVVVVLLLGASLALVGLFALLATRLTPFAAALSALAILAATLGAPAALAPAWLDAWGGGEAILALAFLLPASALLVGHGSRSSGIAAAWLAAAGALTQPLLAAVALALCSVAVLRRSSGSRRCAAGMTLARRRLVLVLVAAVLLAAPALRLLAGALSLAEVAKIAGSLRLDDLLGPGLGLLLAGAMVALATRLVSAGSRASRRAAWALAATSAVTLGAGVHRWIARGQLPEPTRRALLVIGETTSPLAVICARDELRDWVPAIAGRAVGEPGPWIPAVYGDEWQTRVRRPCSRCGDIVSRETGKPSSDSGVLIDRRGDVTLPTR